MSEWSDLVAPTVRKCRLASTFNMNAVFNADASLALASLLEQMAKIIDTEIAIRSAAEMAACVLEGKS